MFIYSKVNSEDVCFGQRERASERERTTSVGAHHPLWVFAQLFALLVG